MNNRFSHEAAEALEWHERQERHKQGYGPRPSEPLGKCWAPKFTDQERMERERDIELGLIQF